MVSTSRRVTALIVLGVFLSATVSISCIPKKLPTTNPGRSGLPTAKYDPGIPPVPWEFDLEKQPIYPGSKQFGSKYTFITPDPVSNVVSYYKENLPDAEMVETPGDNKVITFKTATFILVIQQDEAKENTEFTFKEPEK